MLFLATSIVYLFVEPHVASSAGSTQLALEGKGAAAGYAAQQLPFQASLESVIERGGIEGYQVAIVRFRARLPVDEAFALASQAWRRGGAPVLATHAGAWRVVSAYEANHYRTLQLREAADGGTEGVLSVWPDAGTVASSTHAVPDPSRFLPAGARVLRSLDGVDAGRRHRTLVAVAQGSPAWVAQSVDVRITAQGFSRDPVARAAAGTAPLGQARLYRGAGTTLGVTFHPHDGRTAIVIHLTQEER